MATLCVGGSSSCGSLIQGQCLAQPYRAEVRANHGSTTPHPGSLDPLFPLVLLAALHPTKKHSPSPTLPYLPSSWLGRSLLSFLSSLSSLSAGE